MKNKKITREDIEKHADDIEKNTGEFHWLTFDVKNKGKDNEHLTRVYHPISKMDDDFIRTAYFHAESKLLSYFDKACSWEYRRERIEEELIKRNLEIPEFKRNKGKK